MDWKDILFYFGVGCLILVFVLAIVIWAYDGITRQPYQITGTLVEKHYIPASSGSGVGVGSNGGVAVVETRSEEQYILFLNIKGVVSSWGVRKEVYFSYEIDDVVTLQCFRGSLTGNISCP